MASAVEQRIRKITLKSPLAGIYQPRAHLIALYGERIAGGARRQSRYLVYHEANKILRAPISLSK